MRMIWSGLNAMHFWRVILVVVFCTIALEVQGQRGRWRLARNADRYCRRDDGRIPNPRCRCYYLERDYDYPGWSASDRHRWMCDHDRIDPVDRRDRCTRRMRPFDYYDYTEDRRMTTSRCVKFCFKIGCRYAGLGPRGYCNCKLPVEE